MKQQVETDSPLMRKLIREYIPQANEHCQNQFVRYYELLIDYNNRMNLTAITDPFGIVQRHFADSLLGEKLIPNGSKCIDVGTGAGFPGIPLLIMRPDIELTLLDSLNKRVAFLNDVAAELSLPCSAVHARAEDAAQSVELREKYCADPCCCKHRHNRRMDAPISEKRRILADVQRPRGRRRAQSGRVRTEMP